jgi:hypothetical protein
MAKLRWKTDVDPAFISAIKTHKPPESARKLLVTLHLVCADFCVSEHAAYLVG